MIWLGDAEIISNAETAPGYWWMRLYAPDLVASAQPGQFVHIKCTPGDSPLLRRPMSIGGVDRNRGTFDILYKVVGAGTRLMTAMRPGESADVLGPLGKPFSFPPSLRKAAVLGRGIGVAPLIFWATEAAARGIEVHAFLSARTGAMFFGAEELAALGVRVYTGADDGSGLGSDRLLSHFEAVCRQEGVEYAATCGARRMSRLVTSLDAEGILYGEISLEAQMGCGLGACRGCPSQLSTEGGPDAWRYALVCQEGPVFPARQVILT